MRVARAERGSPRRLPRGVALSLVLSGGVTVASHPRYAAAAPSEPAPSEPAPSEAKAELSRARAAARSGDYAAALEHFEQARRLQPAAKLHFNIAVCHHRLLGEHEAGSMPYEHHRAAAVDSYNRYLQAAPKADDAAEVMEVVRALGGTPLSADDPEPWSIELVEPDSVPDPPGLDEDWDTETTDEAGTARATETDAPGRSPTPRPPRGPAGRLGGYVPLTFASPVQLGRSEQMRPYPLLGLGLRGNAFLGPRRAVALGGELSLTTQPISARSRHRVSMGTLGVLVESRHPLGRRGRLELGAGGVVAVATQALIYSGDMRLRCSPAREASRRNGLWTQARVTFAVLLGPRRNHELSLRLGPGLTAMSTGSTAATGTDGEPCTAADPSAFETLGLDDGAALVVSFDLGYASRL